jgi:biopolymer transport protein ExbB
MQNPYGINELWQQGDTVIKIVGLILLLMSAASWYVIFIRAFGLYKLRRPIKSLKDFWHTQNFSQGLRLLGSAKDDNPYRYLAETGLAELDHHSTHSNDLHGSVPLSDWLHACLRTSIDESTEKLQKGLAILASVGSTAPFIGLFGTVWGIYHALVGIGESGQASIDKVAGPVGEALIMTAFGLAVAIPAVLGYNALNRGNRNVISKLNLFAHQLHAYLITGAPPAQSKTKRNVTKLPKKQSEQK